MKKNILEELLEKLRSNKNPSEKETQLAKLLEMRQSQMGLRPSDNEAADAVKESLAAVLLSSGNPSGEDVGPFMNKAIAEIREVFAEHDLNYGERSLRPDIAMFELGLSMKNCNLKVRVIIEGTPKVCRIDAVLPLSADKKFAYLLCRTLVKENYPRRYGALQYDERDGEVLYQYSYPIDRGIDKDEFFKILFAIGLSADTSYEVVKKYSFGIFKKNEVNEIISELNALIAELRDE